MDPSFSEEIQKVQDAAHFRHQRPSVNNWPMKKMRRYVEAVNSCLELEKFKKEKAEPEHFSDDENFPPDAVNPEANWNHICEDYLKGERGKLTGEEAKEEEEDTQEESFPGKLDSSEMEDGRKLLGEIGNKIDKKKRNPRRKTRERRSYSGQATPSPVRTRGTSERETRGQKRRTRGSADTSQTPAAKVFRATGELLRGASEIKRHYPEEEVSSEQLGELGQICTKVRNDGVVKGDDYVFNREGEYDVEFYPRRLMGSAKSGKLLVLWDQWNFTHCTEEPPKNLRHAKTMVKQYIEYEKGIEAIKKNLEATNWYTELKKKPVFTRIRLPYTQLELSDKALKKELEKQEFLRKIGYWAVKAVEIQWLEVLDPQSKFSVPPLYLESMSSRQSLWKYLPEIEFIKKYEYSDQAESNLESRVRRTHLCVFKKTEDWCRDCRLRRELTLTSTCTVDPAGFEQDSRYFHIVCCHESKCDCEGGWKNCQKWIPTYPRQVPLVVFFDPRYNGWGVRAVRDIPTGTIVSEYVGEVITKKEAADRVTSYQMGLKMVVVDANKKGNESRFFGHSCEPNMLFCPVYVRGFDMSKQYRNVLITTRDIKAGEDMNCDYHPGMKNRPQSSWCKCRCGSANCRGWL